jgi:hypothetical protein
VKQLTAVHQIFAVIDSRLSAEYESRAHVVLRILVPLPQDQSRRLTVLGYKRQIRLQRYALCTSSFSAVRVLHLGRPCSGGPETPPDGACLAVAPDRVAPAQQGQREGRL